ncbi:hypothetical protein DY000_02021331 [Brassica cretica]|uniref:DUF287 domain-containing protein n=1 Tax=Brassica cretica TaxID=69181 RepID=A0ABQ7E5J5_BRACR|nr:hypothetical protein DY000_02021331 [Brassica cretica]
MAKTRWTRRKKTKALKDISTPSKDVPEVDVEENVVQEEERSEEEEANLGENDVEENEEKKRGREIRERTGDENDVEENKENSGEEEARSEEEETNRENDPLGENVHRNEEGGREEGSTNPTLSEDIENILACTDEEETLLRWITEPEDIRDKDDVIVERWMKRLGSGYVVRLEDMFEEDVADREAPPPENGGKETKATNEATWNTFKLNEVVGEIDSRLVASEGFVQELLDARNADADVEEEEDMSKRPKKN